MRGRQFKDGTVKYYILQDMPPKAGEICGYKNHCGLCEVKTQVEDDSLRDMQGEKRAFSNFRIY